MSRRDPEDCRGPEKRNVPRSTLDSVLNQTWRELEVIVVIGIVKNTFRFLNVFLLQALMPQFLFRNVIMAGGIESCPLDKTCCPQGLTPFYLSSLPR